jgi:hypothetical protein
MVDRPAIVFQIKIWNLLTRFTHQVTGVSLDLDLKYYSFSEFDVAERHPAFVPLRSDHQAAQYKWQVAPRLCSTLCAKPKPRSPLAGVLVRPLLLLA